MDASFCVIHRGVQHNVRASKHLRMERLDTRVGPLEVDVVEPLKVLRVVCEERDGIAADLVFTMRTAAIEEPRFIRRVGARTFMDYTRLTQNGSWFGWISVNGEKLAVTNEDCWGTRDRSWGVRTVGPPGSAAQPRRRPHAVFLALGALQLPFRRQLLSPER